MHCTMPTIYHHLSFKELYDSCTKLLFIIVDNRNLPNKERIPHAIQMMKLIPTEPVLTSKPLGETNIPEPDLLEKNKMFKLQQIRHPVTRITILNDMIICLQRRHSHFFGKYLEEILMKLSGLRILEWMEST